MKRKTAYALLAFWVSTIIPLTWLGYGSDTDAWLVARAAKVIWRSRHYVKSRTTGFPLFDLSVTPLVNIGHWYLSNLLPIVFGIIIYLALLRLVEIGKLCHPKITLFSFMFLPVVVKNATSTMDYIPALALLIWAYVSLVEHKWTLAGLFIGIACGFRPTAGLFVIPAAIFTYVETKRHLQVFHLIMISLTCGVIAYSPVLLTYGGIPTPYGDIKLDLKTMILLMGYNALRLFGIVQTLVLGIVSAGIARKLAVNKNLSPFILFHFSNILVWVLLFLFLPDEPEYLMPIVPSIIFVLDKFLSKNSFIFVTAILLSYNIVQVDVLGGESGKRYLEVAFRPGFTIMDIQDRLFQLSTRNAADNYITSARTVLMLYAPWITSDNELWILDDKYNMYRQQTGNLFLSSGQIRDERLETLHSEGFRLVAWRGQIWEWYITGTSLPDYVEVFDDLSDFFGTPIYGKELNQR